MILACISGYYGKNCSIPCFPSCNGTCEPIDGSCKDCIGGKSQCSKGKYTLLSCERYLFCNCLFSIDMHTFTLLIYIWTAFFISKVWFLRTINNNKTHVSDSFRSDKQLDKDSENFVGEKSKCFSPRSMHR